MKHILILLATLLCSTFLFAASDDVKNTGIRVFCRDTKGSRQALVVQSDEPLTLKKAEEFFDDRHPYNNRDLPGTIYLFEPFDLPDKNQSKYESKKQELLKKTKNDYVAKYEGRLGSGGYYFGFSYGQSYDIKLWYQTKDNPDNNVSLSVHLDENFLFGGIYICQHEFFKMEPNPQDEILAEREPDEIILSEGSAAQD